MDKINMQSVTKKYEIYYLYLFIWGYLCCQNTKLTPSCWRIWCRFHVKQKVRKRENGSVFMLFIREEKVLLSNNGIALKLRKRVQQHPWRKECGKLLGYFRPHDNFARIRLIFFPKIVAVNQRLSFWEWGKKDISESTILFLYSRLDRWFLKGQYTRFNILWAPFIWHHHLYKYISNSSLRYLQWKQSSHSLPQVKLRTLLVKKKEFCKWDLRVEGGMSEAH